MNINSFSHRLCYVRWLWVPPLQLENLRYVKNHEGNVKNCLVIIQKCRRFWFSWLCCFFLVFNITRTHIQQPLIYHSVVWFFFLLYFLYCYCFFWYCIIAFSMQSNFLVLQRGSFLKASDNLQWIEINTQDYDNLQKINSMWQTEPHDIASWIAVKGGFSGLTSSISSRNICHSLASFTIK